ncbi:MAG: SRPBCC domain-containing protein [Solirubrobacteraceae bacterium]
MTTHTHTHTNPLAEPQPELRRREIPAGEARVAVFNRTYDAPIDDVWDACTDPSRLRRWYVPVTGDLRVGGAFEQAGMGSGAILRCEPPHLLKLSIGGGADEIELRLSTGDHGATVLELQHATTIDQHEIGGQIYDAIFCMGGGYYPRLVALDRHLRGDLPEEYDSLTFHKNPEMRPIIERGSAAMAALLEADAKR